MAENTHARLGKEGRFQACLRAGRHDFGASCRALAKMWPVKRLTACKWAKYAYNSA